MEDGLTVFRGIPYASLPVRLDEPGPVEPWHGVRECLSFGPPPRSRRRLAWTPPLARTGASASG